MLFADLQGQLLDLLEVIRIIVLLRPLRAVKEDEHEEDPVPLLQGVPGKVPDQGQAAPEVGLHDGDNQGDAGVLGHEGHGKDAWLGQLPHLGRSQVPVDYVS